MKRLLFTIVSGFCVIALFAQQPTKTEIIQSGNYYYGSGISSDENQAHDEALQGISEQIAVKVSSQFESKVKETKTDFSENVTSIINTYSMATLSDVQSLRSIQPDGKVEVFGYIPKDEVKKLFSSRKDLVLSMFQNGRKNEENGNIAFALKNYYFGLVLLHSIPEENIRVQETNLTIEIPKSINEILQGIQFVVVSDVKINEKEREVVFNVTYKGKPVSLSHYRFWDGNQISGSGQVRDGRTTIRLVGSSISFDNLKLFTEYEYFNARKETAAVEQLWDLVVRPEFQSQLNIPLKTVPLIVAQGTQLVLKSEKTLAMAEQILLSANKFIAVIEKGDEQFVGNQFSSDPFIMTKIKDYMRFNHPKPFSGRIEADVSETREGFEIRKIEMHHLYPTMNKQSTEYLVLDFDKTGELIDFNLCITDDLYEKFVKQAEFGNDWGNRLEIIKFVEKYRTAYLTRDMKTIDLMFADEALILVGRKIEARNKPNTDVAYVQMPGQPGFEQLQFTKQQYLTRQKQIFDVQKDIFIDFSNFEIMKKNNTPGVYGVEMRQNYSSTSYADEGYLFLLIDFNEKDPLIYIRAWQPNEWDSSALVNTSNFRIYK
jgi:hypothetical protein